MIGALVLSDKPVVVNSGSFEEATVQLRHFTNGSIGPTGRDVGFDQIVPSEKQARNTSVKGIGTDELERVLLVSNKPNTVVYINGILTPYSTLSMQEII
jgi:hypothetical protein